MRTHSAATARSLRGVVRAAFVAGGACWLGAAQPAVALNTPEQEAAYEEAQVMVPYAATRVPDPHDPLRAAHPVRIAAYALHPVGVALDYLLVRPAVWVVRQEPFRTIFGYQD
jgi:hypothetical protein